ncbi:regulatory protein RecX [Halomonas huangheensis]|uniref:Regulatory protein RecX n=1 Tax=Halomonas huangheensis TaxID=1178482 RepID=W1N2Y6_9GAMM|nr:regulatory protein RecX [Halomonas huangheensis]ALM51414.1 recombinase RecX [Halomonas huangheensis]ERL49863.1 hypothetical protein BJB45_01705 [Halomonas huangheensis]
MWDVAKAADSTPRGDAIRLLARREYSRHELTERLRARGHDGDAVADALQQLADEGLQSDERFAECLLRDRILRGQGPIKMLAELGRRGVDRQLARQSLVELERQQGVDWSERASEVLRRRFGEDMTQGLSPRERARRERFLAGRGFDFEQVRNALRGGEEEL